MRTSLFATMIVCLVVGVASADTPAQDRFKREVIAFVVTTLEPLCEETTPPMFCITKDSVGPLAFWHPSDPRRLSVEVLMQGIDQSLANSLTDAMKRLTARFAITHRRGEMFTIQFSLANSQGAYGEFSKKIGVAKDAVDRLIPPSLPPDRQ